ncbi:inter-alpha-trypsin inhibitor heavy chain H3-like isoform X5 [Dicentrarchus labrax]|uniref:inter-alpha-trypsin inhibitor heavy chain H3-like isoform X5 n=1 Tax=Dicentrarchus labrax TaxID=13489 RepID=UPI0021F6203F|nr:inter-alpha-trypsin inhibitor heavy chain H3-like isoform X5 [Dicentrarchus labrax]
MERAVVQITLFGLLLALGTTLPNKDDWDIYSFHINSTVNSRYATTVITSRVANRMDVSKEIEFHVRIPKNAFISKFKMLIDGQEYDGVVKAKEQAKQQYAQAVSRGQSAGLVSSVGRTLEEFKTSVTVAAHKKVTFELTYEELLKRRLGKYELQIHAQPMQPVKDFKVDVYINENAGINFIEVKGGLSTNAMANAITKTHVDKQAWVYFYPTEDQQKTCDSCGDQGMNGDLVIVYDVNRDTSLGDIKRSAGYFVHHFAPSNLPRIPKNVVFIIDQSGSMHGRKITQTRIALIHILNDLAEDDHFGLITFDSDIFHWKRELVQANKENLNSAKTFARGITDRGATDINRAVLEGARMLNAHPREGSASILILLTDGDPTTGETNLERIHSNVRRVIADKFPLYCLGFGFDVNFEFLEKMSLQNNGVARRIYEDSDADLQLTGFYEEVATPLLTDVTMIYIGANNLTQTNFSLYYNGSEIVVAGQITDNEIETFTPQVIAVSTSKRVVFSETNTTVDSTGTMSDSHIQRVWAYLTVKQLLEKELQLSGPEKENVKNEALRLSLKYSFVTPLTSMVVTKPQGENTDVLHKPKEGERQTSGLPFGQPIGRLTPWTSLSGKGFSPASGSIPGPPVTRGQGFYTASGLLPGPPVAGGRGQFHTFGRVAFQDSGGIVPHLQRHQKRPKGGMGTGYAIVPTYKPTIAATDGGMGTQDLIVATYEPTIAATDAPLYHRFLLKTVNQSLPLCFDVSGDVGLKLLHHPNREMSVNGELDSVAHGGFKRIVIHVKPDQHIEVDTAGITVRDGQRVTSHTGQDLLTIGSVTVIRRNKEIDVAAEDSRMVILVQEKDGEEFLWPVLRQRPSDTSVTGILALKPAVYEEVQQTPITKLKINNQDISVTRSTAVDHSIVSSPTLDCWLLSAESALHRPLNDFIVSQI